MTALTHEPLGGRLATPGTIVLALLMGAGAMAALYRFGAGLGAATNLSDRYPWGLWVSVDIFAGVALAAGSFVAAALVYVFGRGRYQVFVRPALLTGLLGYVLVALAVAVDLGQPLHIWHPIIMWPEHSVMFEVSWCVMFYLTVLVLEFAPPVLERLEWMAVNEWWRKITPGFSVAALAFFVWAMSLSWAWAIGTFIVFAGLSGLLSRVVAPRPGVPLLLIIAGIVFSTMHQSSLGALLLLLPDKLDHLWWTPALPINFFLSAVAVGFAVVIFESIAAGRAFRRPVEVRALAGMGRLLAYSVWTYLGFRFADLALRGNLDLVQESARSGLFLAEVGIGALLPAVMLASARVRASTAGLFAAATLVMLGVVFNRINAVWLALIVEEGPTYYPGPLELLITASIIAAIVFFYALAVRLLPVFSVEPAAGLRR